MPSVLASDPCTAPAEPIWGSADAEPSIGPFDAVTPRGRLAVVPKGGTRMEWGYNSRNPLMKTFYRFYEGYQRTTDLMFALGKGNFGPRYPLETNFYSLVAQWKQTGPVGGSPVLALRAMENELHIVYNDPNDESQWIFPLTDLTEDDLGKFIHVRLGALFTTTRQGWIRVNWKLKERKGAFVRENLQTLRNFHDSTGYPPQSHLRCGFYTGSPDGGSVIYRNMEVLS